MPLPDIDTALDWRGRTVVDQNGEKIGKFEDIYLDEATSRPEWAAVNTGLFGLRTTLVPLSAAELAGDDVKVPFDREHVKAAPNVDPDDQLSQEEEELLYRHYGLGAGGHEAMRPGDQPEVGTEANPRGRVRVKKYVVTETVTRTAPDTPADVRIQPAGQDDGESGRAR
jgi:sporulation protein YlmC with PRC-barrel domain